MCQGLSILFALVVLLSTTGLPRVQHLCGGIVQSAGYWVKTSNCCSAAPSADQCASKEALIKASTKSTSCCTALSVVEHKQKDCCSNEVEWEPSQLDLALGDQIALEGYELPSFKVQFCSNRILTKSIELSPCARPPPLRYVTISQTRRRALLQVYCC